MSKEMSKLFSVVTGWANFSPCRYFNVDTSCWMLHRGTAIVGTMSTSIAIFSFLSVIKCTFAVCKYRTLCEFCPNDATWTVSVPVGFSWSSSASFCEINDLCAPSSNNICASAVDSEELTFATAVFRSTFGRVCVVECKTAAFCRFSVQCWKGVASGFNEDLSFCWQMAVWCLRWQCAICNLWSDGLHQGN